MCGSAPVAFSQYLPTLRARLSLIHHRLMAVPQFEQSTSRGIPVYPPFSGSVIDGIVGITVPSLATQGIALSGSRLVVGILNSPGQNSDPHLRHYGHPPKLEPESQSLPISEYRREKTKILKLVNIT